MKRCVSYLMALFMLASCAERSLGDRPGLYGRIDVTLMAEQDVARKSPVELTPEQSALYMIGICNSDGTPAVFNSIPELEIPVVSYTDFILRGPVEVALGKSYYVTAFSCTEEVAENGNGCARYAGRSDVFTLNASNISENAKVVCEQTNALVTVVFDRTVAGRFSNLKVEMSSDANQSRTVVVSESDGNTGVYFNPAQMTYRISGTYKHTESIGTTPVSLEGSRALAAKDNVRLLVKLNMGNGLALVPSVSVMEDFQTDASEEGIIDPYGYENQ